MPVFRLPVIPEPKKGERTVFLLSSPNAVPFIIGDGGRSFACGACGAVLLKDQHASNVIANIVVRCLCGAFCEVDTRNY